MDCDMCLRRRYEICDYDKYSVFMGQSWMAMAMAMALFVLLCLHIGYIHICFVFFFRMVKTVENRWKRVKMVMSGGGWCARDHTIFGILKWMLFFGSGLFVCENWEWWICWICNLFQNLGRYSPVPDSIT